MEGERGQRGKRARAGRATDGACDGGAREFQNPNPWPRRARRAVGRLAGRVPMLGGQVSISIATHLQEVSAHLRAKPRGRGRRQHRDVLSSADREGKGSQPFFNPPARRGVWAVSVRPLDHTRGSTARTPSWGVPLDLPVATRAGRRGSPAREPKCRGPIPLRANVR